MPTKLIFFGLEAEKGQEGPSYKKAIATLTRAVKRGQELLTPLPLIVYEGEAPYFEVSWQSKPKGPVRKTKTQTHMHTGNLFAQK